MIARPIAKQAIINIINAEVKSAQRRYVDAVSERAAIIAAANTWDDFNKEDGIGGMSQNPYSPQLTRLDTREIDARNYYDLVKEAHDLAVYTFIGETSSSNS